MSEVRLVPMREIRDDKGKVLRYTHLPFPGSAEEWWESGITEAQAAHIDHALHPDRCSDCDGMSRRLRKAFGHTGPERWPWP